MWSVLKIGIPLRERAPALDVTAVHTAHAEFVWTTLYRLGVHFDDLPDMLQEVFIIVHVRAHTYDSTSKIRTWLYGICLRVAQNYRRKAHRRRERLVERPADDLPGSAETAPERQLERTQALERLSAILDEMSPEKRAVFVMFEVEGQSCDQIADALCLPLGTVYSRLRAARKSFARSLARWNAGEDL